MTRRCLSRSETREFYDRFGVKQDKQAFYEDPALGELVAHSGLEGARAVVELGCGTGRLARGLLERRLPAGALYAGCDLSSTMVALTSERLAPFRHRAVVVQADSRPRLPFRDGAFDRFLSTYVLDLLPPDGIRHALAEAHRLLRPGGRACLAGITRGTTPVSKLVMRAWSLVHRVSPSAVGGCRPIRVAELVDPRGWEVEHLGTVIAYGVASEVLVLQRR